MIAYTQSADDVHNTNAISQEVVLVEIIGVSSCQNWSEVPAWQCWCIDDTQLSLARYSSEISRHPA